MPSRGIKGTLVRWPKRLMHTKTIALRIASVTVRLLTRCLGLEARGEFGIVDEVIEELVPGSGRETRFA